MAQPADLALWASDTNIATGTEAGTPTKVDPGAAYEAQGLVPGATFVGPYVNWCLHNHSLWLQYLQGLDTDSYFLGQTYTWTALHHFSAGLGVTGDIGATGAGLIGTTLLVGTGLRLASGELLYSNGAGTPDPRAKQIYAPLVIAAQSPQNSNFWYGDCGQLFCGGASVATVSIPITVPTGCTLLEVKAQINRNAGSSGANMAFRLRQYNPLSLSRTTLTGAGSDVTFGGTGTHTFTSGTLSTTVARNLEVYYLEIDSSGVPAGDRIDWVEVTMDDPGPRNY